MTTLNSFEPIGCWHSGDSPPEPLASALQRTLLNVSRPVYVVERPDGLCVSQSGTAVLGGRDQAGGDWLPLRAYAPPLPPEALGEPAFKVKHGLRYAYVAGEMANGITSVRMVTAVGKAGMVGFFGAAGLMPAEVETALARLQSELPGMPFGVNLIHSPGNLELEAALTELFLRRKVRLVSASAYVDLTHPLVYYRVKGIHRDAAGRIVCPNRVIAKVSRVEVARKFLAPPPEKILGQLVGRGLITAEEAALAAAVPMADDVTAEADSGGHTDNRPAITLLPTMLALRDEMSAAHGYPHPPCVGLGGGIATPATAAAFAMGAAYVVTGSINQACVESGTSPAVRAMLAEAGQADVTMAPAADMFELGVKVQVLKRGTMFAHAGRQTATSCTRPTTASTQLPAPSSARSWKTTSSSAPSTKIGSRRAVLRRARPANRSNGPKRTPSTRWRWCSARTWVAPRTWATAGEPARQIDYQIWCGPAMGAFNQWVKGSPLEKPRKPPYRHGGHEPAFRRRRRHPRHLAARPGCPCPAAPEPSRRWNFRKSCD